MYFFIAVLTNDLHLFSISDQLQELRKVKLGGIICANMNHIRAVQPDAMLKVDPYL